MKSILLSPIIRLNFINGYQQAFIRYFPELEVSHRDDLQIEVHRKEGKNISGSLEREIKTWYEGYRSCLLALQPANYPDWCPVCNDRYPLGFKCRNGCMVMTIPEGK